VRNIGVGGDRCNGELLSYLDRILDVGVT